MDEDGDEDGDEDSEGGRSRRNEWRVVPPIATAAAPVVAVTPTRFPIPSNLFLTSLITADFPVPPGPVSNRLRRASATIDIASCCSFEKVIIDEDGDETVDNESIDESSFSFSNPVSDATVGGLTTVGGRDDSPLGLLINNVVTVAFGDNTEVA